jgi:hypothetical protein
MKPIEKDPKAEPKSPQRDRSKGTFAEGQRKSAAAPASPDFAQGQRGQVPEPETPDFASGQRQKHGKRGHPDFARGQHR